MESSANFESCKIGESKFRPQRLSNQRTSEAFNKLETFVDDFNAKQEEA